MIFQGYLLILVTFVLTITGLMTQYYYGAKKLYQASFTQNELRVVSKALSNHIAASSGNFLFKLKNKLKLALENGSKLDISEELKDLGKAHTWGYSQAVALNEAEDTNTFSTIIKLGTGAKSSLDKYQKNTDLKFKYDISLIQSEFLETYPLETESKLLASLISEDKINLELGKITESFYEDRYINASDELDISEETLKALVDENSLSKIQANPEKYGLNLTDSGLKLSDLATGLRFKVKFPVVNLEKDKPKAAKDGFFKNSENSNTTENKPQDSYRDMEFIANSQLRISEKLKIETAPEIPIPIPIIDTPVKPNPPVDIPRQPTIDDFVKRETQFDLMVRSLPASSHGILFNPNSEISAENPLRIANSSNGGISTIYVDPEGHLNISIGKIKDEDSFIGFTANERKFQSDKIAVVETFSDNSATLDPNLNIAKPSLVLDILPRENKRYGTVDEAFKYQGLEIPSGAIIVATKEAGNKDARPENNEFSYFKVYDANGALITKFHTDDLGDKSKIKNVNFNYTEEYTEDADGSAIYQSFSTADLFKGKSSTEAVKAFLNIQADLASTQQLNINQQRKDWHDNLYSNFKSDGLNYTNPTLETNDPIKAAEILIAEKVYINDKAKDLDKKQVAAMIELELARDLVEQAKIVLEEAKQTSVSQKRINEIKEQVKEAEKARDAEKKDLEQARNKYDDYMANRAKAEPVKTVNNEPKQNNSNANNQPKAAASPQVVAVQSAPKTTASAGSSGNGGGGGGKRK